MDEGNDATPSNREVALAAEIARRYEGQVDVDDLAGELRLHLLKLKRKKGRRISDWRAYLAKSLLRRADRIVRFWSRRQEKLISLESVMGAEDGDIRLEELLAADAPDESLPGELMSLYEALGPKEKRCWDLLVDEGGNTVRVAKRLRKPRKTVDYHIQKLRQLLKNRGFGV